MEPRKLHPALGWLVPLIALLAFVAAAAGLFYQTSGEPYVFTNHRGETALINGRGLYAYDTVSSAAQMQGNDLVTLLVALPLLLVAARLAGRGSLRGKLLLSGTLGYFLYTYMSMAMLASFNLLFLVYVILFSASLFAFILSMLSFDLKSLPAHFSPRLPRGWIAGLMFFVAGFLSLAWLARIVMPFVNGSVPVLENTTTMVIQAMDLGLILPLSVLSGVLLLRRSAWGYLLASITLLKGISLGLAVSAMAINMMLAGVPDSLGIMIPFLVITLANLVLAISLFHNVHEKPLAAV